MQKQKDLMQERKKMKKDERLEGAEDVQVPDLCDLRVLEACEVEGYVVKVVF
jgi:hypothetical protein